MYNVIEYNCLVNTNKRTRLKSTGNSVRTNFNYYLYLVDDSKIVHRPIIITTDNYYHAIFAVRENIEKKKIQRIVRRNVHFSSVSIVLKSLKSWIAVVLCCNVTDGAQRRNNIGFLGGTRISCSRLLGQRQGCRKRERGEQTARMKKVARAGVRDKISDEEHIWREVTISYIYSNNWRTRN